jgi:hypothetical protein
MNRNAERERYRSMRTNFSNLSQMDQILRAGRTSYNEILSELLEIAMPILKSQGRVQK